MFKEWQEHSQITLDFVSVVSSKVDLFALVRECTALSFARLFPFYRCLLFVSTSTLLHPQGCFSTTYPTSREVMELFCRTARVDQALFRQPPLAPLTNVIATVDVATRAQD